MNAHGYLKNIQIIVHMPWNCLKAVGIFCLPLAVMFVVGKSASGSAPPSGMVALA